MSGVEYIIWDTNTNSRITINGEQLKNILNHFTNMAEPLRNVLAVKRVIVVLGSEKEE